MAEFAYRVRTKPWAMPLESMKTPAIIPRALMARASVLTESGGSNVTIAPWLRRKLDFRSFVLLSCCAFPCVLAISRRPIPQRAQAREGEAEKLQLSFRYLDCS